MPAALLFVCHCFVWKYTFHPPSPPVSWPAATALRILDPNQPHAWVVHAADFACRFL